MPYHRAMALASLPAKSSGGSPFRVGGWPGGVGAGGLWVMRPGAAGHGHIRASYPAPEPGGARWKVPGGRRGGACPGAGARTAAGVPWRDRRQVGVGGRPPARCCCFRAWWARPGTSAAALAPACQWVCLPRCLPSLVRAAGHAGRASALGGCWPRAGLSTR